MPYELVDTPSLLRASVADIRRYTGAQEHPKLANDLETWSRIEGMFPHPYPDADGVPIGQIGVISIGFDPVIQDLQYIWQVGKLPFQDVRDAVRVLDDATIIGQNFQYDWRFFWVFYRLWLKNIRDTMLISQCLHAGRPGGHSLMDGYRRTYTRPEFIRLTGKGFSEYDDDKANYQVSNWRGELTGGQLQYAADDVRLIWPVFRNYERRMSEGIASGMFHRRLPEVMKRECRNVDAFSTMNLAGVPYDREYHETEVLPYLASKEVEGDLELMKHFPIVEIKSRGRGKNKVIEETVRPINAGSWQQVIEACLPFIPELARMKKDRTSEKTLKQYEYRHPGIAAIVKVKKAKSLQSKFGVNLFELAYPDGRFHPSIFQIGQEATGIKTGRSSYSKPNLQQIPQRELLFGERKASKVFRRMVKPSILGNYIVSLDYSTIEPRGTAEETRDENLILELRKGKDADLHALTGKGLLGLDYLPARGTFERDTVGKVGNLAMGYQIGPRGLRAYFLQWGVDWSEDECKEKIDSYFRFYAGVKRRMNEIEHQINKKFYQVESLVDWKGGHPIYIQQCSTGRHEIFCLTPDEEEIAISDPKVLGKWFKDFDKDGDKIQNHYWRRKGSILREAYNFTIQGMCADIMKLATRYVMDMLLETGLMDKGVLWFGTIHDEFVFECPKPLIERLIFEVDRCMVLAGEAFITVVPIVTTASWGEDWGSCK